MDPKLSCNISMNFWCLPTFFHKLFYNSLGISFIHFTTLMKLALLKELPKWLLLNRKMSNLTVVHKTVFVAHILFQLMLPPTLANFKGYLMNKELCDSQLRAKMHLWSANFFITNLVNQFFPYVFNKKPFRWFDKKMLFYCHPPFIVLA